MIILNKSPKRKCKNCGKDYWHHKSNTLNCPLGKKTKIGYISYYNDKFFEEMKK